MFVRSPLQLPGTGPTPDTKYILDQPATLVLIVFKHSYLPTVPNAPGGTWSVEQRKTNNPEFSALCAFIYFSFEHVSWKPVLTLLCML